MTSIPWEHLHPLTQSLLREKLVHSRNQNYLDCGCSKTTSGSWQLCAFHEGFDEGAETASPT